MNLDDVTLYDAISVGKAQGAISAQGVVGLQIQYIGSYKYGTVTVADGGDMTFYADDTDGNTTLSTTLGSSGVIDLSSPAAGFDTVGELADHINASGDWRCMILGMRRADATDNCFAARSQTQCKVAAGIPLYIDSAVALKAGFSITNRKFTATSGSSSLGDETDENQQNFLSYLSFTITSSGGVNGIYVYGMTDTSTGATTERLIVPYAGGASTEAKELKFLVDQGKAINGYVGERIFVQVTATTQFASPALLVNGWSAKRFS